MFWMDCFSLAHLLSLNFSVPYSQISGDYEYVKSALFQLAGRLRENFFSRIGYKGAKTGYSSCTAISSSSPDGIEASFSTQSAQLSRLSHIDELDHLGFVQGLQWEQVRVLLTSLWLSSCRC